MRLTLREKFALPSPKWLIFIAIVLLVIGIVKLLIWITPLAVGIIVKVLSWLLPYLWQSVIFTSYLSSLLAVYLWRKYQISRLKGDVEIIHMVVRE